MKFLTIIGLLLCGLLANAQDNWVAPESAKEVVNVYSENDIATQKGAKMYQKLCWTCHGKTGQGDGPAGSGLKPKPRNFSLAEVQDQSDGELFWKLSNGKGMMIPYKHSLNEDQRWQLINFIRTFKK
ncbi:MAG: cytochrome c [Flavobacteriales bacterium]|tara:strand:+ start:343 stop:723 length:381 start_codon:yes stop_codon:yes gene_type:complete